MSETVPAAPLDSLLIAGIPRSGSTLLAALVDSLDNALCLGEPRELFIPPEAPSRAGYVASVLAALDSYREKALRGEDIADRRNPDGSATTNYMKAGPSGGVREFSPGEGVVDTSGFRTGMLIAIKHNIPFLSVLPELAETGIPIIGVVRNPVHTLLSWHDTGLPVAAGYMPSAQAFWPELNRLMAGSDTPEAGWAKIYNAFCVRLREAGCPIVKYEEVTADISILENLTGRRSLRKIPIVQKDWREYPGSGRSAAILEALQAHAPEAMALYPQPLTGG
jgi:hypothetical protein